MGKKDPNKQYKYNYKTEFIGAPRLFNTPEEFVEKANAYFHKYNDKIITKMSWTGLCLAVGAESRQALDKYKNGTHGSEFVGPVKAAMLVIERYYEEGWAGNSETKDIFVLKNFNWTDKSELGITPGEDDSGNKLKWQVEVVRARDEDEV